MANHKNANGVSDRVREVTGREVIDRVGSGGVIIDVRTPAEFGELHAASAINIPLDQLTPQRIDELCAKHDPVFLICKSGARARRAAIDLIESGRDHVACVAGGVHGLERAGAAMIHGRKAISLERQVRIAAGGINLLGIALAVWVNPWCLLISALIGAGLVFAGITDYCGMGLLLAKMPWNRRQGASCERQGDQNQNLNLAQGA